MLRMIHSLLWAAVRSLGVVVALVSAGALAAENSTPQRTPLWPGPAPVGQGATDDANAFITVHRPAQPNGTSIVICPGGGYGGLVTDGEGSGIARWLNGHGITGIVLEYRLPAGRPMVPMLDAQRAIRTVRANAREWGGDPSKIGIIGFSAGGHLASTAATHFDDGDPQAVDPVERVSSRPDFAILVYPVITMGDKTHGGSRANLLGPAPSPDLIALFSNELQVTARTSPTYLAHAADDRVVPPDHSRMFLAALRKHAVAAEYLELPSGDHGLNGYKGPMWDAWQAGCLKWLADQKLIAAKAPDPSAAPVKVFILAGQSNMEGQAVADLEGPDYNGGQGTLATLLRDPAVGPRLAHLRGADGKWTVRDDVWVRYQREKQPLLKGPLSLGYAIYGGAHHFGPELQFGHVVGDALANPVLLIKTAWGGRSLCTDFRPPSSGGSVGPYYTKMIAEVREGLGRLKEEFPALADRPAELAGFVWYHGWNDGCESKTAVEEYEQNLVNLIKDVRHDLAAPGLPVVVGELTGPWVEAPAEFAAIRKAQAAAASRPELATSVRFVPTHSFVRPPEESPNPGHGHHEFGNAETYFLVGAALGQGMIDLLGGVPAGYQTRTIEGWKVHLNDELLTRQKEAVDTALPLLQQQLQEIIRVVPAAAVARLREVPLWFSPEYSLVPGRAEYHPGADWLRENGRNPAMVKGVEFTDTRNFAAETSRMPNFVLHELAHAYHDRELSFDQPDVIAAYDHAMTAKLYDRVARRHGNGKPDSMEPAYATTNHKEYFAELTEALFSANDFFPFTRDELAQHDPKGFAVVHHLWGLEK